MRDNEIGSLDQVARDYFDSLLVEMRYIDGKKPDTSFTLYGEKFRTPIMTSALSCPDGGQMNEMVELAKGAAMAGAVNWAGMGEKEEIEKTTAAGAGTIQMIEPYADNDLILDRIAHAEKCGVLAVGINIDHAFDDRGEYKRMRGHDMAPKSVEEIRELADAASRPFIVKGVLGVQDAYKALTAGAKGIMISNHHRRVDYALTPLMILPEILKVVNGRIPVFVDCGIISGIDAFKALALGAAAVCAGRVMTEPLEKAGAEKISAAVTQMNDELKGVMAGTGCYDLAHMDKTVIHKV